MLGAGLGLAVAALGTGCWSRGVPTQGMGFEPPPSGLSACEHRGSQQRPSSKQRAAAGWRSGAGGLALLRRLRRDLGEPQHRLSSHPRRTLAPSRQPSSSSPSSVCTIERVRRIEQTSCGVGERGDPGRGHDLRFERRRCCWIAGLGKVGGEHNE